MPINHKDVAEPVVDQTVQNVLGVLDERIPLYGEGPRGVHMVRAVARHNRWGNQGFAVQELGRPLADSFGYYRIGVHRQMRPVVLNHTRRNNHELIFFGGLCYLGPGQLLVVQPIV